MKPETSNRSAHLPGCHFGFTPMPTKLLARDQMSGMLKRTLSYLPLGEPFAVHNQIAGGYRFVFRKNNLSFFCAKLGNTFQFGQGRRSINRCHGIIVVIKPGQPGIGVLFGSWRWMGWHRACHRFPNHGVAQVDKTTPATINLRVS